MAVSQIIWSLDTDRQVEESCLEDEQELEDLLCRHINILNGNWIVVGRQVRMVSGKYLDILCMDRDGDMVIVELKKDMTPREVTAQVIDYASCVQNMRKEEIAEIYLNYSNQQKTLNQAYEEKFGTALDDENVNTQKIKMVIVATKMDDSTERIISYLREEYNMDMNILFFRVFQCNGERFISHTWFEEENEEVQGTIVNNQWNNEYYVSFGHGCNREWEDARKYGFISAGGGAWYTNTLKMLSPGDRVWVNVPHTGYVGVGIVTEEACLARDARFEINGESKGFADIEMPVKGNYLYDQDDEVNAEYIVKVEWQKTVRLPQAVKELGFFGNQNTVCRPTVSKWQFTIERLKNIWGIQDL